MIYLAATELLLLVGLVWLLEQRHTREVQTIHVLTEQHAVERAEHLGRLEHLTTQSLARSEQPHPDLHELVGIVDRLCQRVQAPDVAVTEHSMTVPVPPQPQTVLPDDDRAWWESQGFEIPKEELAQRLDG